MNSVSVYIIKIITVAFASVLCEALTDFQMTKAVKFVCGMCICVTIFSFLSFQGEDVFDISFPASESDEIKISDVYKEKLTRELENQISADIYENFGIMPDSVCINISMENETVTVQGIDVSFAKALSDAQQQSISDRMRDLFGAKVTFIGRKTEN
ncbi:MAG: hypothetical protein K6D98_04185 [Clostridiales bacterium]|nr:hypothetical protein [Clostridiales bacterium]